MFDIKRKTIEWGGKTLTLETGRMARQADGAVLATYGETMVLATAVYAKSAKPGQDFFPLTVNYQEKFYAAGKIPGSFPRREGAPSQKETLTSRLIDRPIRPLFVKGFKNEVQVVTTVLAHDLENDPDIVALVAASAALVISGAPFMGPIGAARVGFIDGEYVLNPTTDQMKESRMDLVVAGTQDAVMMVESEIQELSEDEVLGGVTFAHKGMQAVIDAIIELAEHSAKEPFEFTPDDTDAIKADVKKLIGKDLAAAYKITGKTERHAALSAAKDKAVGHFGKSDANPNGIAADKLGGVFKELEADVVRRSILDTGIRIDGRKVDQVRQIVSEVGVLPRAHGSALFTRGETQALVVATLGTGDDEQLIDALDGKYYEKFMLHYNFPPFSVGETGRMGAPGRREVGHGKLAWRAIRPMLPPYEEFPYTIRLVSEIFESNGSSSMASVCGSSLALMDAGVPLKKPVSGIAMGLILESDGFAVLSDILGDEDHLGDMDFKVAGTSDGITSLQMDIKIAGITEEIMKQALAQAKGGRDHILNEMNKAMEAPRAELGEFAPKIETIKIAVDKIREVIGSGGKVIREITAETGAKIDIGEDGTIKIAAAEQSKIDAAKEWIKSIASEPEIGAIYTGKVVKIVDFGAFVNFFGAKDGLVHVSQIANERVNKVSDVLQEGQAVKVKLLGFDDRGKTRLSMKVVDQETGEDLSAKQAETADA
ncbi:MAG: polyribonucleotide nucleotidyltransferase [Phenylobacterium sp. RIFCSPHIGHO2_01_FULL_69_31]|jgi:polyribonucleotide nucleotidyltransferase|uniref:polyribonucleotide nucleotidyltransferase n=1 Tax=Phenylobacterium sp. RIFCSPHIGHO2_01_FULL_69_31 TaxID=1801944 RepID=UPI0008CBFE18|nr:polyribonucleotide nucleotidyltransferase [Phenylobacterium sp. RIFCSPHIGHO2_01_FULL_69_31]OHB29725.1 MAG: polyribonucleotide nucleotidyltransferase [Phenylobacterium sp. RIFCSPHIGHO2_01_FULL_69_31]